MHIRVHQYTHACKHTDMLHSSWCQRGLPLPSHSERTRGSLCSHPYPSSEKPSPFPPHQGVACRRPQSWSTFPLVSLAGDGGATLCLRLSQRLLFSQMFVGHGSYSWVKSPLPSARQPGMGWGKCPAPAAQTARVSCFSPFEPSCVNAPRALAHRAPGLQGMRPAPSAQGTPLRPPPKTNFAPSSKVSVAIQTPAGLPPAVQACPDTLGSLYCSEPGPCACLGSQVAPPQRWLHFQVCVHAQSNSVGPGGGMAMA